MAERNAEVMEMVAQELERDPEISVDALFEKAKAVDPAIGDLSRRQFHARYPLPIKRRKSQGKRPRKPRKRRAAGRAAPRAAPRAGGSATSRKGTSGTPRDEVRRIFLDFAGDLARAESRASIVEVIARVDEYVDRALASSGGRSS